MAAVPQRRSIYEDKLLEYPGVVVTDPAGRRGRWRGAFRERLGVDPARVILDVGCAAGTLLAAVAPEHTTSAFVGLDWTPRSLYHAARAVQRLPNVALLHGRAQRLSDYFAPGELGAIYAFHPEPDSALPLWTESFLAAGAEALSAGGDLILKTDHPGYFQRALALVGADEPAVLALQRSGAVRGKGREFAEAHELPPRSAAVRTAFDVACVSGDFWNDPAALAHAGDHPFGGHATLYEDRFRSKRLPIYYLALRRRS